MEDWVRRAIEAQGKVDPDEVERRAAELNDEPEESGAAEETHLSPSATSPSAALDAPRDRARDDRWWDR